MLYKQHYWGLVFNIFQKKPKGIEAAVDLFESSDIGENEDQDVRAERQKVTELITEHTVNPPVVMVQVKKLYFI